MVIHDDENGMDETRQSHTTSDTTSGDTTSDTKTSDTKTSDTKTSDTKTSDTKIRLNPEILEGTDPLPELEKVRIVYMHQAPLIRWSEGVAIHLVGGTVLAGGAFLFGFLLH